MKKQYMPVVKCGHSPYDEFKVWHKPITKSSTFRGIYANKETAMLVIKEALAVWDGKPRNTPSEMRSAKMAKEMMITDWKIKVREVSDWEVTEEGCAKYDESFAEGDPKEDCISL